MKMNAAVLWDVHEDWSVEEIDLDGPQEGEVLVSFEATGLCHSDHHVRTGDLPLTLPLVGGHEGAGIVREVGPGVRNLNAGDHVVGLFLPALVRDDRAADLDVNQLIRQGRAPRRWSPAARCESRKYRCGPRGGYRR